MGVEKYGTGKVWDYLVWESQDVTSQVPFAPKSKTEKKSMGQGKWEPQKNPITPILFHSYPFTQGGSIYP